MFDHLALRTPFWGAISLAAFSAAGLSLGQAGAAMPNLVDVSPWIAGTALLVAVAGWRLLHRELLRRMQDDDRLRERVQRLHEAMHVNVDGMFLLRAIRSAAGEITDFEITDVNSSGAATMYRTREQLIGQPLRAALPGPVADLLFERYVDAVTLRSPLVEEVRVNRRTLAASWLFHQAAPTADGLAVTIRDVSVRKRDEIRLRKACLVDDLTQLYNRRGFMTLAEQHLRIARRQGKDALVMYVDMDNFKQLNDTHGHAMGDRALKVVSRLLQSTVRDCDIVGRMGGDEFTVIALDADGTGAKAIQKRLDERLALFNASGELPATLALTVGHTRVRPSDSAALHELLARADQLLYARKRRRRLTTANASRHQHAAKHPAKHPAQHTAQPAPATRRPARLAPMPIPPEVAAVAHAAAMALPNPGIPVSHTLPVAVPGTLIPTHAA